MEPKNSLINARLLLWHDSKDNWAISTKIPMLGEPCIEQDGSNMYMKIGDGIHKFKDLNYITTKIVDETNDIRIDNLENNIIEISNRVNNIENGNMTTIEPTLLDIPVIYFSGDSLPTTKDSKMLKFRYVSNTNDFSGYVKIKCQGTSSMGYNKKNFTITMYDDEALTIKKQWILNTGGNRVNLF